MPLPCGTCVTNDTFLGLRLLMADVEREMWTIRNTRIGVVVWSETRGRSSARTVARQGAATCSRRLWQGGTSHACLGLKICHDNFNPTCCSSPPSLVFPSIQRHSRSRLGFAPTFSCKVPRSAASKGTASASLPYGRGNMGERAGKPREARQRGRPSWIGQKEARTRMCSGKHAPSMGC
jgi:hypothetical protein